MVEVDPELSARWARPRSLARSFGTLSHIYDEHHSTFHRYCIGPKSKTPPLPNFQCRCQANGRLPPP